MSVLPERPSLEHLRKQAKTRRRERGITLSQAQHELAREYGFTSWPKLVHAIQAGQLHGIERALVLADPAALAAVLEADPRLAQLLRSPVCRLWRARVVPVVVKMPGDQHGHQIGGRHAGR